MGNYLYEQQEHINALQKQLDRAKEAETFISEFWPNAYADNTWDQGRRVFKIRLKQYGHVWASEEHEHEAWIAAKDALERTDVFGATVFERPVFNGTL